ncbi:TrkH family potassium uptake protein [Clostridium intestinale]|uniref:Trk system potassium uptake protein TrkH n=1 Tax=Clostridium intestinale DSM 6191 TaxID=1121320 RepID=A0A1M5Y148_9CLOT|nr:TrkH family potassium uptake protein [Clostridium intestinale]SHI05722.1 trk system potassium uptake protein TrkH [Clostridium intestinale DSM 6191]
MNFAMVLKNLGKLLVCEALSIVPAALVSIYYKENEFWSFLYTIIILIVLGVILIRIKAKNKNIYSRDGFAIVAIGWILLSFFGALPFYFSGAIPSLVDSFFEASSGFTTTGATILGEIESLSRGILFWRSFTHWIGGMGVLVLVMAILPSAGAGSMQIMKAESPGPNPGKLVPKVKETAKILYGIYLIITIVQLILLKVSGLPLFDSIIHTLGTVGTGGFSSRNISVGAYNNLAAEIIITVFMLICGANFALHYQLLKGNIKGFFKDGEFKLYLFIVTMSIILITFNLNGNIYNSVKESLRHASFQVASIITTTGYATVDFNTWPSLSKLILLLLMFVGGCAGSTAGGLKNIRILLLFKAAKRDLLKIIHPKAVYTVTLQGKAVNEQTLSEVLGFFFMYVIIFCFSILIVSFEGKDIVTTISSVATTLGNVGPGLEIVGPMGNFSSFTVFSKLIFSFCMIVGRLEIYPMILLLMPRFWAR